MSSLSETARETKDIPSILKKSSLFYNIPFQALIVAVAIFALTGSVSSEQLGWTMVGSTIALSSFLFLTSLSSGAGSIVGQYNTDRANQQSNNFVHFFQ